MRKQKRLKRKSLETERIKAQHGLEDSTDIIIVEHSNTLSVMIQAAGQIVRFLQPLFLSGSACLGLRPYVSRGRAEKWWRSGSHWSHSCGSIFRF